MKKLYFIAAPILLALLIAGCSKSNVPPPTPLDEKPPKETHVKVKWKTKTGNGNGGLVNYKVAPAYSYETVLVPNQNGMVYGLAITNGKIIWKNNTGTNLSSEPNTIANAVIFGSIKGVLSAINAKDGKTLWRTDAPSSIFAQPTIYNNHIYIHSHDGSISSFDAKNGSKDWSVSNNIPEISLPDNSSAIVLNNTVMVGTEFGTVLGFTLKDGDRTINIPVAIAHGSSPADKMVDIAANPMLYDNYLIFAAYQRAIVALDKNSGKMLWAKKSSIINNMTINNNIVFTTQDNSELKAYNIQNGNVVWKQDTLKWRNITGPAYYKGLIVVADYQGYLHFFNSLNGEYLGRYKLTPKSKIFDYGISSQLVPTEKGILVEANNGTTYLVDAYSDKVIYDSILSDYKIDKGENVEQIYPLEQDTDKTTDKVSKKNTKKSASKGLNVNVIIGDFSRDKAN